MTATNQDAVPLSGVVLPAEQRLRLLRSLPERLLRFPEQEEVLATLLARWPELFSGSTVIETSHEAAASDVGDLPRATGSDREPDSLLECVVADLIAAQREVADLHQALASNRTIGTATGILMAHYRVTQEQAFELLRQASQRSHRKLRDLAAEVVFTGTLPDTVGRAPTQRQAGDGEPGTTA